VQTYHISEVVDVTINEEPVGLDGIKQISSDTVASPVSILIVDDHAEGSSASLYSGFRSSAMAQCVVLSGSFAIGAA
jgi:hypothetical protein